jgi:hypothetical protein
LRKVGTGFINEKCSISEGRAKKKKYTKLNVSDIMENRVG